MGERRTPKKNRLTGSAQADWVLNFISNTKATDIPKDVRIHARYLLLDLIGVAAAGSGTPNAKIITDFAVANMAAGPLAPAAPRLP